MILFEDNNDVHIYMDDSTGKYYYYNGEKLILLGSKPQIGDRGNNAIQDREEEERRKQIEKEEEEGEVDAGQGSGGGSGEDSDEGSEGDESQDGEKSTGGGSNSGEEGGAGESEKERLKRLQRIQDKLNDAEIGADISYEATDKVDREKKLKELRKKQIEASKNVQKYKNNPGLVKFRESLNKFIKNEVGEVKEKKWSRINKKYAGTGTIKPGISKHASGKIPLINVYYDRSGSWDASMTAVGDSAISTLSNYVRKGQIKIHIYYFNTEIHTTDPGGSGGTRGTPILNHIKETRPDNVIVMTDDDIRDCSEVVTVPGAVWLLFVKDQISENLQEHLKGKKLTRSFELIV